MWVIELSQILGSRCGEQSTTSVVLETRDIATNLVFIWTGRYIARVLFTGIVQVVLVQFFFSHFFLVSLFYMEVEDAGNSTLSSLPVPITS